MVYKLHYILTGLKFIHDAKIKTGKGNKYIVHLSGGSDGPWVWLLTVELSPERLEFWVTACWPRAPDWELLPWTPILPKGGNELGLADWMLLPWGPEEEEGVLLVLPGRPEPLLLAALLLLSAEPPEAIEIWELEEAEHEDCEEDDWVEEVTGVGWLRRELSNDCVARYGAEETGNKMKISETSNLWYISVTAGITKRERWVLPRSCLQTWANSLSLANASLLPLAAFRNQSLTGCSEDFLAAAPPTLTMPSACTLEIGRCWPSLQDCWAETERDQSESTSENPGNIYFFKTRLLVSVTPNYLNVLLYSLSLVCSKNILPFTEFF